MEITLTPALEKWVRERLATGLYASESEVVREALRLMQCQQEQWERRRDELRRELSEGLEQLERGEGQPFDASVVDAVKKAGRAKLGRDT